MMLNCAIFRHYDFLLTLLLHLHKLCDLSFLSHKDFDMMKRNMLSCPTFHYCLMRVDIYALEKQTVTDLHAKQITGMAWINLNKILVDDDILKYIQNGTKSDTDDGSVARKCLSFVFQWVCVSDNNNLITELLAAGADPNIRSLCVFTPLHCASLVGYNDIVTLLLKHGAVQSGSALNVFPVHGADISERDVTDSTPILTATICGHGANANDRCGGGRGMPIHHAVTNGNTKTIDTLLNNRANIYAKNKIGLTPLMIAAQKGYTKIVKTLIKRHYCISDGIHASLTSTLTHSAFIDATDTTGLTALQHSVIRDHTDTIKVLLDENASTNIITAGGDTLLHITAYIGHVENVKYLIKHNSPLSMKNNEGVSPFHIAVAMGHLHVVDLLLTEGADKFTQDTKGRSVLYYAFFYGRIDMVECLIKYGCKIDIMDNEGMIPLHVASIRGNSQIANVLLKHGACKFATYFDGINALHFACYSCNTELINMLLKSGFNTRDTDLHGNTVLHHTAAFGSVKSLIFLINCGANQLLRNRAGRTAIHEAAFDGHLELVTAIIQHVAGLKRTAAAKDAHDIEHNLRAQELVSLKDKCGNTALQLAAYNGHSQTVALLYEHGADLLTRDKRGKVVKHSAFTCGGKIPHIDCSINSNSKGQTPLHISI